MPSARRFPPLWTLDEMNDACFTVRDNTGQALAYIYFEDEPGRRSAAKLLTSPPPWQSCRKCCGGGEAADIAATVAKLPEVLRKPRAYP